jgi:hypothetical protein
MPLWQSPFFVHVLPVSPLGAWPHVPFWQARFDELHAFPAQQGWPNAPQPGEGPPSWAPPLLPASLPLPPSDEPALASLPLPPSDEPTLASGPFGLSAPPFGDEHAAHASHPPKRAIHPNVLEFILTTSRVTRRKCGLVIS